MVCWVVSALVGGARVALLKYVMRAHRRVLRLTHGCEPQEKPVEHEPRADRTPRTSWWRKHRRNFTGVCVVEPRAGVPMVGRLVAPVRCASGLRRRRGVCGRVAVATEHMCRWMAAAGSRLADTTWARRSAVIVVAPAVFDAD